MNEEKERKGHRRPQAGRKADKKKKKKLNDAQDAELAKLRKRNVKAFTATHRVSLRKRKQRYLDVEQKRMHMPKVDKVKVGPKRVDAPPVMVAIVGPPQVGKSTLMKCLLKHYTKQSISKEELKGPISLVTGKKRRMTFFRVGNDLPSQIAAAKVCDVALLLINARFGFEMETFEFINILRSHELPRVIGILTHLDEFKHTKQVQKRKKEMKKRFWEEIFTGAKLFYFSGLFQDREYMKREIVNLSRFLSQLNLHPLSYRKTHPYIVADRVEDITPPESLLEDGNTPRQVSFHGFVRGTHLREGSSVHLHGVGDYKISSINAVDDPVPLPVSATAQHSGGPRVPQRVRDDERIIYGPMSNLGGVIFDADAVYIDMKDKASILLPKKDSSGAGAPADVRSGEGQKLVEDMTKVDHAVDATDRGFQLFPTSDPTSSYVLDEAEDASPSSSEDLKDRAETESTSLEGLARTSIDISERLKDRMGDLPVSRKVYGDELRPKTADDLEHGEDVGLEVESFSEEHQQSLRNLFVTGEWSDNNESGEEATDEGESADLDSEEEGSGQTGEDIDDPQEELASDSGDTEAESDTNDAPVVELNEDGTRKLVPNAREVDEKARRMEKKKRKKALFNKMYDLDQVGNMNATAVEEAQEEVRIVEKRGEDTFAFETDEQMRELVGYPPGTYVRVVLESVTSEFVSSFSPASPVVLGGLLPTELIEDGEGVFINLSLLRHRWFKKLLKTNDPLVISAGWRLQQILPIYSMKDGAETRLRMLKYTPKHLHCVATAFMPPTPPGTGITCFQALERTSEHFRIAATGVVVEMDESVRIVKKLRVVGYPHRIEKKTAFIRDMFTTQLEAAKFEGALVRTVSGIRGVIKRASGEKSYAGKNGKIPAGTVRATFEDKILASDIVFLTTWVAVEPNRFYLPVLNSQMVGFEWMGMRTTAQVRRSEGIGIPQAKDSEYKPVNRSRRVFNPLRVPAAVQKDLPFKSKIVEQKKARKRSFEARRPIVRDREEKKIASVIDSLNTIRNEKSARRKRKRTEEHARHLKEEAQAEARRKQTVKGIQKRRLTVEAQNRAKKEE